MRSPSACAARLAGHDHLATSERGARGRARPASTSRSRRALERHEHLAPRIRPVRAIVTGGAGFIGSHVAEALVARGDEVHVLDDSRRAARQRPGRRRARRADIRNPRTVFDAAARGRLPPRRAGRRAASRSRGPTTTRRSTSWERSAYSRPLAATERRSSSARPAARSTASATARAGGRSAAAALPLRHRQAAAEEYLAGWNRLYGTRHVALRFANVYGPRQARARGRGRRDLPRAAARRRATDDLRRRRADARLRLRGRRRARDARGRGPRRRHVQHRHGTRDQRNALHGPASSVAGTRPNPTCPGACGRRSRSVSTLPRGAELGWRPRSARGRVARNLAVRSQLQ